MRKIILWMPELGESGTLCARFQGEKSWIEFRGPPYSRWQLGGKSDFEMLHDTLAGWQSSVLHSGDVLALLPEHPEYESVRKFFNRARDQNDDNSTDQSGHGDNSSGDDDK